MVNLPALSTKQNMDAPVAITDPGSGDFTDSHAELGLIVGPSLVSIQRPGDERDTACLTDAHIVVGSKAIHQFPAKTRP
ncbi:hypothetical protein PSDVSF_31770 [Pseudodesulfovibrio sediminis]|uniref:Uncharacterized protein n=1 Tax=Pseudodesulfovibrio sediminis TaxID=2810563 RepID=A0ABM7PA45_9BACT|nr:hypothetical protein PSDVSF_31770 [Pseudodesulfovibrio sediminis]